MPILPSFFGSALFQVRDSAPTPPILFPPRPQSSVPWSGLGPEAPPTPSGWDCVWEVFGGSQEFLITDSGAFQNACRAVSLCALW